MQTEARRADQIVLQIESHSPFPMVTDPHPMCTMTRTTLAQLYPPHLGVLAGVLGGVMPMSITRVRDERFQGDRINQLAFNDVDFERVVGRDCGGGGSGGVGNR